MIYKSEFGKVKISSTELDDFPVEALQISPFWQDLYDLDKSTNKSENKKYPEKQSESPPIFESLSIFK